MVASLEYSVSKGDYYERDKFHLKIEISEEKIIYLHTDVLILQVG